MIKPLSDFSQNNIDMNNLLKELSVKQVSINNQFVDEKIIDPAGFISDTSSKNQKIDQNSDDIMKAGPNAETKSYINETLDGLKNLESEELKFTVPPKGYKNIQSNNGNTVQTGTKDNKEETQSVNAIQHDNDKQEKQTLMNADLTRQENKDQSKSTEHEILKNSVQQIQTLKNDFGTEKVKLFSDATTLQEAVKNIKTSDLIPEFSKLIIHGEKQNMTFQLSPENLGKVRLSVEMVNNHISTNIEVENEQVKQFIQSNIEQLKHNLQQEGIKYNSVNINLADYGQRSAKSFSQKKKYNNYNSKEQMVEEIVITPQKKMGYNTYEYLA